MSKSIKINCVDCNTPVSAADINLETCIAKCQNCHSVFGFQEQIEQVPRKRPEITMPENVEVLRLRNELDINFSWWTNGKKPTFLIFFTVFWNFIVGIFVVVALATGEWMMLAGISAHLTIGVGLAYYLLCKYFNKTVFRGDSKLPYYKTQTTLDSFLQNT